MVRQETLEGPCFLFIDSSRMTLDLSWRKGSQNSSMFRQSICESVFPQQLPLPICILVGYYYYYCKTLVINQIILFVNMLKKFSNLAKSTYYTGKPSRKDFAKLSEADIGKFSSILPIKNMLTDSHDLEPHNMCWRKLDRGQSRLLLQPENTNQISQIMAYCNERKLAVVPQGGNTGLVGGSVPVHDQIILSLSKMNKIISFDEVSSIVTCEAGVILDQLNQFLDPHGFETPLDLGAKGSCQVGGNASTNAGGKYVIKYGSFRSHILGLEAVMANGTVLDLTSQILKDNTGFDIKQLLIGGEGTIGVITKLNILCEKIDNVRKLMVLKTNSFDDILKSVPILKKKLGKNLAALEYADSYSYNAVIDHLKYEPFFEKVEEKEHLLFVQVATEDIDDLWEDLPEFNDSVMSNSDKQYNKMWRVREEMAVAAAKVGGKVLSYDISFDVKQWPKVLQEIRDKIKDRLIIGYGHIGDGNLHVNMCLKEEDVFEDSNLFKLVASRKGSISAEHGVGLYKPNYLHLQKSPAVLELYRQIKAMFDPKGILNPYKVIPEAEGG